MTDKVLLPPGKYIVAVSGGVDSVVLLNTLANHDGLELVVAHFEHGIRSDSANDQAFVATLAQKYGLEFVTESGNLGPDASEAEAREKRYAFLYKILKDQQAKAIVTAHHQDDVIETCMINLLRGTGRHGITALKNRPEIIRPFLDMPKTEIIAYAQQHALTWQEDSTNTDPKYLRNKIRLQIMPKLTSAERKQWLLIIANMQILNEKIDVALAQLLRRGGHKGQQIISRSWFIMLPHDIAKEVIVAILRQENATEIDKKTVERIVVQIKTLPHGKTVQAAGVDVLLTKRSARFKSRK